jgi:hypothetical protein
MNLVYDADDRGIGGDEFRDESKRGFPAAAYINPLAGTRSNGIDRHDRLFVERPANE